MIQACLYGNSFLVSRINFLQSKEGASFSLCELARFSMLSNISLECSAMTFGCVRLSMSTHMHCLQEIMPRNCNSNAVNTNLIGDSRGLGSVSSDILFAGKSGKVATKTEDATPQSPETHSFSVVKSCIQAAPRYPFLSWTHEHHLFKNHENRGIYYCILMHIAKSCIAYKKPTGKRERFPTSG